MMMLSRGAALAVAGLLAGCAAPQPAFPSNMGAAIAASPLRDRLRQPPAVQRAAMVAHIRAYVAAAAPSAVTPAFDRALAIVGRTRREDFVQPGGRSLAYVDLPQEIGWGQTISDPSIVTLMTAALDLPVKAGMGANVLDIGTGSGYQAAILSPLVGHVWSVEIVDPLARAAATRLRRLGYPNVTVRSGDGFGGWPEHAPFDGIVVAAGAAAVPRPLIDQLKIGGRLVMPVGPNVVAEHLLVFTKKADGTLVRCSLGPAMFVDLTGKGRAPPDSRGLLDRTMPLCHGAPLT